MEHEHNSRLLGHLKDNPRLLEAFQQDAEKTLSRLKIILGSDELEFWKKLAAKLQYQKPVPPEEARGVCISLLGA